MTNGRVASLIAIALGLALVGIIGGVFEAHGGSIPSNSPVGNLLLPAILIALLLMLLPGWMLLAERFPSGARSQYITDRLWLGAMSLLPLAAALLNMIAQPTGIVAVGVLRGILTYSAGMVGLWYLYYCLQDLAARKPSSGNWGFVLWFGNAFAFPVYWWLYLRPRPTRQEVVEAKSSPLGCSSG